MRPRTVWLALGLATLLGADSVQAYFLDKDGNFDVRGRIYNQVAILTENAAEQENCRVIDPNTGKTVVTPACLQFSSGNVGQERTFWNPELDAKLTPYIGWMNGAPGLSVLTPDDLKFRFAWWGYYDGVFDYTNPEWAAALRAQRVRLAETDDTRKSFVFQDHSKNVRSILGHDNRINELYLDYAKDRFFFRVGRQAISWGESDTIALLDISNPFDLRVGAPGFFQDVDEARMPLWTLRSTIKLVENWRLLSGLFTDIYVVPGPIESTVPVNPTWFGTPYAAAQPSEDPQVAQASLVNPVGGHVSIVDRLPRATWSESRYGARLGAVVARDYTVSTWFFRTYPEQPTPLITSPSFLELPDRLKTLIDDRGNRVPVCNGLGPGGTGIGHTPSGRQCTFARPAVTELFRRLESVFGIAGTWYSPMVGGVIRSEAEYFLNEDAFIPHVNLNPQAQVPGTGVVNHIPQADYLRWTLGYDRFFFFRPLNPTNSFILVTSWNGQWNVTASRNPNLNFRNPLVKPGKLVVGPLGQQQPDSNWEDQRVIEHFFQIALQTDYLHGKLEPRVVAILDPSGIFGLQAGAVYRLTDNILFSPNFLAVAGSRRTGLATFRDRDQFQLRVTYQLN